MTLAPEPAPDTDPLALRAAATRALRAALAALGDREQGENESIARLAGRLNARVDALAVQPGLREDGVDYAITAADGYLAAAAHLEPGRIPAMIVAGLQARAAAVRLGGPGGPDSEDGMGAAYATLQAAALIIGADQAQIPAALRLPMLDLAAGFLNLTAPLHLGRTIQAARDELAEPQGDQPPPGAGDSR
jgi:hypothetical protein